MSDEFDRASDLEEVHRDMAIQYVRTQKNMPDIGCCYYCQEPTKSGIRFCDSECRDGFDAELAAKRRNG